MSACRWNEVTRPPCLHDRRTVWTKIETRHGGDARQKVAGILKLNSGNLLHIERDEKMSCSTGQTAVAHARVEPVVLTLLGILMRRAIVVGVTNPQVGRVPESAGPQIGTRMHGIVSQPEIRRG